MLSEDLAYFGKHRQKVDRGEVEALELASSAGAWAPDGGPHKAWQAVNQLGFVTGLPEDSGG